VFIDHLNAIVVGGLSLNVQKKADFPGALSVNVDQTEILHHKYQESLLDISLHFDDGTSFPLALIPPADFALSVESLGPQTVIVQQTSPEVTLKALRPGSGDLIRLALSQASRCGGGSGKPRLLAAGSAHVNVDYDELTQSDASYYRADIDRFDWSRRRYNKGASGKGKKTKWDTEEDEIVPDENRETGLRIEAQKQSVVEVHKHTTTTLELAMYILLAVFAVSVLIFTTNCLVFVTKNRNKRKFTEPKVSVSEVRDWVWIGRSTLQRNAVDLTCPKRLMSDADFTRCAQNSRPLSQSLLLPSSGPPSNRNSTVSTYQGSECSVRITANPLSDANGNEIAEPSARPSATYTRDASARFKKRGPGSTTWSTLSRDEQLHELEQMIGSRASTMGGASCESSAGLVEWNSEEFGMSYAELMEYFDNLKESIA